VSGCLRVAGYLRVAGCQGIHDHRGPIGFKDHRFRVRTAASELKPLRGATGSMMR
jgi:hypothetical protein